MEDNLKQAIEQMKNGVEKGFNEVYSQTYNRVYFRAKQIMKKEEDAQDLTQIVFVEAYKCIGSLQASEALFSWLDGITYRQGMKLFRKNKDVLLTEEAEGLFDTLENNDLSTAPELSADQKATSEIIKGIIEELPELQKTAIVMFYFDGMKVEQIASAMECSENTIKSRLNYARKFIKNKVEEKEKTEGYRLHTLVPPVFFYAIKTISDNTTLTAQTAQEVYTGACTTVGLQATAITVTTGAGFGASAGAGASTAGAGVSTVSAVVGETAKAVSIGAKLAALSTGIKTVIIAAAVVVTAGVVGILYAVNHQEETKEEESIQESMAQEAQIDDLMVETLESGFLEDVLSSISSDEQAEQMPEETTIAQESTTVETEEPVANEIVLTEADKRQISAFVGSAYVCDFGYDIFSDNKEWNPFSSSPDDCLMFVLNYIHVASFWEESTINPLDLPYDWVNRNVSTQEMTDFFLYGLGIEIPSDYSFSYTSSDGYYFVRIEDGKLNSEFDLRTIAIAGENVEIVEQTEDSITLSGTFIREYPGEEATSLTFTVTGVPSGRSDILGGITITSIDVQD